jgi:hypothetical protein
VGEGLKSALEELEEHQQGRKEMQSTRDFLRELKEERV